MKLHPQNHQRHRRKKFAEWEKRLIAWQQRYRCAVCSKMLPFAWELDHINPLFNGGSNDRENVQILCGCCHGAKSILERSVGGEARLMEDGKIDLNWAVCPERVRGRDRELQCSGCGQIVSPHFSHACPSEAVAAKAAAAEAAATEAGEN